MLGIGNVGKLGKLGIGGNENGIEGIGIARLKLGGVGSTHDIRI